MDAITIEERLAHLQRVVDDLSDVVARQDRELAALRARVAHLLAREVEREAQAQGDPPADAPPPHW